MPVGTSCDISERQASAQRDGYSLATAVDTPKVTIAKGAKTPVTVTNTYTRLVGGFTIGKTVDGDGAGLAPKAFDFAYACVDSSGAKTIEGTVTVAAGKSQSVADVPTGSCTVTEKNAAAKNAKHSTAISANGKAGKDGSVTFNVTDGAAIAVNTKARSPDPSRLAPTAPRSRPDIGCRPERSAPSGRTPLPPRSRGMTSPLRKLRP